MSKKILFLEDDGYLMRQTVDYLRYEGYDVKAVSRIDLAREYMEDHYDSVDCIITDLNMNDEWLDEYRSESCGCLLSGWIWLKHFVFNRAEYKTNPCPCIIYSGYIGVLKSELEKRHERYLLNQYNVKLVEKGGNDGQGYKGLSDTLKAIFERGDRAWA